MSGFVDIMVRGKSYAYGRYRDRLAINLVNQSSDIYVNLLQDVGLLLIVEAAGLHLYSIPNCIIRMYLIYSSKWSCYEFL